MRHQEGALFQAFLCAKKRPVTTVWNTILSRLANKQLSVQCSSFRSSIAEALLSHGSSELGYVDTAQSLHRFPDSLSPINRPIRFNSSRLGYAV